MKKIVCIIAALVLAQCKKSEDTKDINVDSLQNVALETAVEEFEMPKPHCYMATVSMDSVFISYEENLGTIIGRMKYKNFDKDDVMGEISGFKVGDTLKLTLELQGENSSSKRDIFLLSKEDQLHEAIGPIKTNDGHIMYANENKLSYDNGLNFVKHDCDKTMRSIEEKIVPKIKVDL